MLRTQLLEHRLLSDGTGFSEETIAVGLVSNPHAGTTALLTELRILSGGSSRIHGMIVRITSRGDQLE